MAIPKEFIEELHERIKVEDLIGSYVELKGRKNLYVGLCPFHSEKTPSFTVYPNSASYYCFGCHESGDIISFVMKAENLEYVEAIRFLADRYGMKMPEDGSYSDGENRKRILEMNKLAGRYFFNCLNSDEGREARTYLRSRGLKDETIVHFGIGYAGESWNGLRDFLKSRGYSYEEAYDAGLISKSESKGSFYDFFRQRVMFPVIDIRGQIVAFSGRTIVGDSRKYLNTRDTTVFKKSKVLFGLNFAKNAGTGRVILAEGQMDVISLHQAGFNDAVATLGTAITEEHARILTKYVTEAIVSYDADEAGQKATRRAIDILRKVDMPVRVISVEGGKDPDELIRSEGSSAYQALLDKATGSVDYELSKAKKKFDLGQPEGKVDYVKAATEILSRMTNPAEREIWAGKVSDDTGVNRETIVSGAERIIKARRRAEKEKADAGFSRSVEQRYSVDSRNRDSLGAVAAERRLIALLDTHQDLCSSVRKKLSPADFTSPEAAEIFETLCLMVEEGEYKGSYSAYHQMSQDAMNLFIAILAENRDVKFSVSDCDFYVDKILEKSMKPSEEALKEMEPEEIREMLKKKRQAAEPKKV